MYSKAKRIQGYISFNE